MVTLGGPTFTASISSFLFVLSQLSPSSHSPRHEDGAASYALFNFPSYRFCDVKELHRNACRYTLLALDQVTNRRGLSEGQQTPSADSHTPLRQPSTTHIGPMGIEHNQTIIQSSRAKSTVNVKCRPFPLRRMRPCV